MTTIITEELLMSNELFLAAYNLAHDEYVNKGISKMIKSGLDNDDLRNLTGGQWSKTESRMMVTIYNEAVSELYFSK
jgi:hypothetical protein